jgi:FixJ family two-component response regulator
MQVFPPIADSRRIDHGLRAESRRMVRHARASVAHERVVSTTIFVVDSSAGVRQNLADAAADRDAEVVAFASAEDFLLHVAASASGCVVAPSDLGGMGIRELIAAMRLRHLQLPVIVLGHDDNLPIAVELMRAGATDYLEPPVSNRRLRAAVSRAILVKPRA